MKVLVTGAAGFIGFHVTRRLLARGDHVTGLDNVNSYYDVTLKEKRIDLLSDSQAFKFVKASLQDRQAMQSEFDRGKFEVVIHLAAQAGVRYSIQNPHEYVSSNVEGFLNILEG